MNQEFIQQLKQSHPGSLTADERKLLEEFRATINATLEHNLAFTVAASVLSHDLNEIVKQGSLKKALSQHFTPKARSFSAEDPTA